MFSTYVKTDADSLYYLSNNPESKPNNIWLTVLTFITQ